MRQVWYSKQNYVLWAVITACLKTVDETSKPWCRYQFKGLPTPHGKCDFYPGEPQASLKSCDHSLHLPRGAEDQSRGLFSQSIEKPHMVTPRVVLPPGSAASRRQVLTDSRVKYSLQPRAGPLKVSGLSWLTVHELFLFPNPMGRSTELLEDCNLF